MIRVALKRKPFEAADDTSNRTLKSLSLNKHFRVRAPVSGGGPCCKGPSESVYTRVRQRRCFRVPRRILAANIELSAEDLREIENTASNIWVERAPLFRRICKNGRTLSRTLLVPVTAKGSGITLRPTICHNIQDVLGNRERSSRRRVPA